MANPATLSAGSVRGHVRPSVVGSRLCQVRRPGAPEAAPTRANQAAKQWSGATAPIATPPCAEGSRLGVVQLAGHVWKGSPGRRRPLTSATERRAGAALVPSGQTGRQERSSHAALHHLSQ